MNITFRVIRQMYRYRMNKNDVARGLGMSYTVMKYKLRIAGTSFQALLKAVKYRMARSLIRQGKTIDCICHELDYGSRKSFRVAFKGWSGITYDEYRGFM